MKDHELRNLRRELATLERGRGKRYPGAVRRRVASWARRARARGEAMRSVADALALSQQTLRKWIEVEAAELVPVEITGAMQSAGPVVLTPAGFRIDGLTIEQLTTLLLALR